MPDKVTIDLIANVEQYAAGMRQSAAQTQNLGGELGKIEEQAKRTGQTLGESFGASSPFGQTMQMLRGGGALLGIGLLARGFAQAGQAAGKLADSMQDASKNAADLQGELFQSLPIIGDLWRGVDGIWRAVSGIPKDISAAWDSQRGILDAIREQRQEYEAILACTEQQLATERAREQANKQINEWMRTAIQEGGNESDVRARADAMRQQVEDNLKLAEAAEAHREAQREAERSAVDAAREAERLAANQAREAERLAKAEADRLQGIADTLQGLQDQIDLYGQGAEAAQRLALVRQGATEANLDAFDAMNRQLEQMRSLTEQQTDAENRAAALTEKWKTEAERLYEQIQEINELEMMGLLDPETVERARQNIQDALEGVEVTVNARASGMIEGLEDFWTRIQRGQLASNEDQTGKAQLSVQQDMKRQLEVIAQNTGKQPGGAVFAN